MLFKLWPRQWYHWYCWGKCASDLATRSNSLSVCPLFKWTTCPLSSVVNEFLCSCMDYGVFMLFYISLTHANIVEMVESRWRSKKITSSMWGICAHKSSSYCIFRAMPRPPLLSYTNNYMLIIINTTWTTYEFWRHANWLIFRREASPQRRPSWQQKTSKGIGGQLWASTGSRVFSMASIFWWMLRRLFSLAEAIHDKERSWQWMK